MLEELGHSITLSVPEEKKILRTLQIPPEQSDQELLRQIRLCLEEVLQYSSPRFVLRILPAGEVLPCFPGNDIRRLLDGCDEVVLMALTLGAGLEKRLMQEEVTNMYSAYMMDVCASATVEDTADELEKRLRNQTLSDGKYLTNRYSPGYGDFPLETQSLLLEYLNAARSIGLTLTRTQLMVPRKSITAVMGICDRAKPDVHGGCGHCPISTKCSWKKHGERCFG